MSRVRSLAARPFGWLWQLVKPQSAPSEESKEEKATPTETQYEDLRKQVQRIRDSLRTMGGAFAAAAGVIVGGLGYARLHEAFPLPPYGWWRNAAILALVVGAFLTLGGAAWFSGRFFAAQRRIPMRARIPPQSQEERGFQSFLGDYFSGHYAARKRGLEPEIPEQSEEQKVGLSKSERALRREMFTEDAEAEGASTLEALELRADRLDRIARRLPKGPSQAAMENEAARLYASIRLTFMRTATAIVERRAQDAYSGWRTMVAISAFIVGVVLLFGTADWAKGERDLIALRASCAEAEIKGAPDACKPVRAEQTVSRQPALAEVTAKRLERTRTDFLAACIRQVFDLAKSAHATAKSDEVRKLVSDKDVISAAITLCGGPKSG
jgi:hypothetical protein